MSRRTLTGSIVVLLATALAAPALSWAAAQPAERPLTVRGAAAATTTDGMTLWYDEPAPDSDEGWETRALPIGNGALGAAVFGGVESERLQFNEKTLWTGGPGSAQGYDFGNWREPRPGALEEVQQRIEAEHRADPAWVASKLGQPKRGYGSYQTFGDVRLDVEHGAGNVTGYSRSLDIADAVAGVRYKAGDVTHTREYFASAADDVIVARLTADHAGAVSVRAGFSVPGNRSADVTAEDGRITLAGSLDDNGMRFESQLEVLNDGGTRHDHPDGSVSVEGADAVTLLLAAGTDYAASYPDYRGDDPHAAVTDAVDAAAGRSYDQLRSAHIDDHRELFDRVSLDIGQQMPDVPTDELLAAYRDDSASPEARRALEVLYFQYGRYLLVASSRPGSLPANLQGVWSPYTSAPWGADYHVNINLQMNYWPAEVTNLSETTAPLFDYIDSLVEPGQVTAEEMFGNRGWVVHNETTPFGFTGVHDWATAFWFPEAGAWLAQHYYEHYLFTGDGEFLRERAFPMMRRLAEFWIDELVVDPRDGALVVNPSYSPEHGDFSAGASMSQQIVWDLLTNVSEAAELLDADPAFRAEVAETLDRLDPGIRVGSWGQLQEWKEDWDDPNNTHRHVSHLYGLHPGRQISPLETPELAEAAEVSLTARGDGGTGWSKAWKINFWARLLDGDHAHTMLSELLKNSTLDNLWDTHPPFQIDGNFGATAGVAEMLLQSQHGEIDVLPAVPAAWPDGSVDGLRARGGFTVGTTWRSGTPAEIRLTSDNGGQAVLHSDMFRGPVRVYQGGHVVPHRVEGDTLTLKTRPDANYRVVAQSQVSIDVPDETYQSGDRFPVSLTLTAADRLPTRPADASIEAPDGWTVEPTSVRLPANRPGTSTTAEFTVTVPAAAADGAHPLEGVVTTEQWTVSGRAAVEVWRPNFALGRPAEQSSTAHGAVAARAVDGNTSGAWGGGSVTHTADPEDQAWWQTDLGVVEQIGEIAVWNRTDCCSERLSDYYVFVSDEPFDSESVDDLLAEPDVWAHHESATAGTPTSVDVGRSGRYVRVQLAGTAPLSLAEVQVYGSG